MPELGGNIQKRVRKNKLFMVKGGRIHTRIVIPGLTRNRLTCCDSYICERNRSLGKNGKIVFKSVDMGSF